MTHDLELALTRMPAPDFKARLWATLERHIMTMSTTVAVPAGFRNLTPYLLVPDVDRMLGFYTSVFGAETTYRTEAPRGIRSSFRLGDSMVMMGGPVEGRKAMLHLYVDALDATVARALDAGARLVYPITQAPYGERFGAIDDPAGNTWIIADRGTSTLRHPDMGTVTPYLNPAGAATLIEFLRTGLGAEEVVRYDEVPRGVAHCKMRLGPSFLEVGDPEAASSSFTMMFYLYVASVDDAYERALRAGAQPIHPPARQHYGDYVAAFTDPVGNQWYVAEHQPEPSEKATDSR